MFLLTAAYCLLFVGLVSGDSTSEADDNDSEVAPRLFLDMDSGMSVLGEKVQSGVSIKRPAVPNVYGTMFIPTSIIISGVSPLTFGYVYHPFFPSGYPENEKSLLLKVWTSSALRDNMVTVFGHLLFQGKWPGDVHTYSALMLLYNNLRHRQISTIDLLPALLEASTASPSGQMLVLLNRLSMIVPRYLKSAVEEVIISASKNQHLIDNLMRPEGGPLVVDFLAGINGSHIVTVIKPIELGNINEEKEVIDLLGHTFSHILASIFNGYLRVSQPLFAGILTHLPTNRLNSRGEEILRVFVEYLKGQKIKSWSSIVVVKEVDRKYPYKFVQRIIKSISTSKGVSESIRESATYIIDYLQEPQVAYSNPYFRVLSPIISKPSINVLLLLESITYPEYPADVVDVRNRIVYYIQHGYLDIDLVTKGFMRYDHVKPVDLVIAILTRIATTMPQLPPEIMSSVKSLTVHLIFKELSCNMASTIPSDLMDLYLLVVAFKSPSLPKYFVTAVDEVIIPIIKALPNELTTILSQMPIYLCTQPRTCLINVFVKVKDLYPLKIQPFLHLLLPFIHISQTILQVPLPSFIIQDTINITGIIDQFPEILPPELPPILPPKFPPIPPPELPPILPPKFPPIPPPEIPPILPPQLPPVLPPQLPPVLPPQLPPVLPPQLPPIIRPTVAPKPPSNTSKKPIKPTPAPPTVNVSVSVPPIEITLHRPEIWTILISVPTPPPGTSFPLPSPIQEGLPVPPGFSLIQLFPAPLPGTPEFELLKPIRLVLSQVDVTRYILKFIKVEEFKTRGELLRAVLNFLLKVRIIQELPGFIAYIKTYLYQLDASKHTHQLEIYWVGLLTALPMPSTQIEIKRFEIIKTFLEGNISSYIAQGFDVKPYQVKGQLLKALLKFLLTLPQIKRNQELFMCIQYYVERVLLHGFGAQPIEYIIATETITSTKIVDLTSVFAALDRNRFDLKAKDAFKNIIKYFSHGSHFQGFNFSKYTKKGPFLKALFEFIIERKDTTENIRKNFQLLIPYIRMNGPGAEPVSSN